MRHCKKCTNHLTRNLDLQNLPYVKSFSINEFIHPIRYFLEFIAYILFKMLIALLLKILHDILYYLVIRKFFLIYVVNPLW